MGNSEVGHLNLGAGRPVLQDLPRIDAAIADGSFDDAPGAARRLRARAARPGGRLHVIGLVGPGGVHANDRHLVALARLAASAGRPEVARPRAPRRPRHAAALGAGRSSRDLEARLAAVHPDARIATVGGRYYAMDRDQRWERTKRGYDAIVHGVGEHAPSAEAAIEAAYARGETDEFVAPTVDRRGRRRASRRRPDRPRQLPGRPRPPADARPRRPGLRRLRPGGPAGEPAPRDLLVVTMTAYEAGLPVEVAFGPEEARSLAQAFCRGRLDASSTSPRPRSTPTSRTSSTAAGRRRGRARSARLVPSPKVATYDLQPEMSAAGVTDELVAAIESGRYDFIVANYANPDMVGHTGVWDATVAALETIDACLGRVVDAVARLEAADPVGTRRRAARHRRPRQRRRPARRGRQPGDRALAEPGPAARVRPRCSRAARSTTASSPTSRRRSSSSPACPAGMG